MSASSIPVIRPRASSLPGYPPTVIAASTSTSNQFSLQVQHQFQFAPEDLICYVRCCHPDCQPRATSAWRPATDLSFRVEEIKDDPILCSRCILQYPNLPAEQISAVWLQDTDPMHQMYRILCRESVGLGSLLLPFYIADKEEIVSPRSPFVQPLWEPAVFDENNRRIYLCPECNRSFRKQSRYVRHVSEHINLYECRHCHQPKARVEDTKNHLIRTCLPRHYPNINPSRFDGDETDTYHYSRHYRWRTNEEFLNDSRNNFAHHNLGWYPAVVYALNPPQYYPGEEGYNFP